jgi:hypothetical protein
VKSVQQRYLAVRCLPCIMRQAGAAVCQRAMNILLPNKSLQSTPGVALVAIQSVRPGAPELGR